MQSMTALKLPMSPARSLHQATLDLGQEQGQELLGRVVHRALFADRHGALHLDLEHRGIMTEVFPEAMRIGRPTDAVAERVIDLLASSSLLAFAGEHLGAEFGGGPRADRDATEQPRLD